MEAIKEAEATKENRNLKSYPRIPKKKGIQAILNDEQIKNIVKRVAKRNHSSVFIVQRRAKKILKEMVADLSVRGIKILYSVFKFIWKRLYLRLYVDFQGLQKIKPIIQNYPVILVPSHKSHLDYLLLSSIFHENGLVPPLIAAGVNLSFWPLGYVFRKTGAFFIRRSIGTDILYYKILFSYMASIIKEKETQEFFIEGGRSRNGKSQNPKLGLLTLQVETFLDENIDNLYFVPISIAYDRILEESAYLEEITGGKKIKESIWEVIKSAKVFKSNYGNSYIRFGNPISLKDHLAKFASEKFNPKIKKTLIKDLGLNIMKSINNITPITPTALTALSILSKPKRRISHDDLLDNARLYLSYLKNKNAFISEPLEAFERGMISGIAYFTEAEFLRPEIKNKIKVYKTRSKKRISLDYYKNNIIHFFVPLLFVGASLNKGDREISLENIKNDFQFLSSLFASEFLIDKEGNKDFASTVSWLESERIVRVKDENGAKSLYVEDKKAIQTFANGLRNYLEAYYAASVGVKKVLRGELKIREGNLLTTVLKSGLKLLLKKEILNRESLATPYLQNALKFINKNVISSIKNVLPVSDLEEEDDMNEEFHDSSIESGEQEKINNLILNIKKFLVD